jgi:multidrug efflux pump subunit AcrA (membrane-fusion protein)
MVIKAPFSGRVTNVKMKIGETADATKFIGLLAEDQYELEIYIPESNIRRVKIDNPVEVRFDAAVNEVYFGKVGYISPQSMQVEGVSYYSAKIQLDETPAWIREGLSADVEIIFNEVKGVLVVPRQYILEKENETSVLIKNGENFVRQNITTGLQGTNGLIEVVDLQEGLVLVRP